MEGPEGSEVMLTYEHLQSLIESCLVEAGYYEVTGSRFVRSLDQYLVNFEIYYKLAKIRYVSHINGSE